MSTTNQIGFQFFRFPNCFQSVGHFADDLQVGSFFQCRANKFPKGAKSLTIAEIRRLRSFRSRTNSSGRRLIPKDQALYGHCGYTAVVSARFDEQNVLIQQGLVMLATRPKVVSRKPRSLSFRISSAKPASKRLRNVLRIHASLKSLNQSRLVSGVSGTGSTPWVLSIGASCHGQPISTMA